jgi:hypothetical protein
MKNVFKPLDDQAEPVEVEFACFGSPIFLPEYAADLSQTAVSLAFDLVLYRSTDFTLICSRL